MNIGEDLIIKIDEDFIYMTQLYIKLFFICEKKGDLTQGQRMVTIYTIKSLAIIFFSLGRKLNPLRQSFSQSYSL